METFNRQSFFALLADVKILFGPQIVCPGFWQLSLDTSPQENVCHAKQPLAKSGPHFTYIEARENPNSYFENPNLGIMIHQFLSITSSNRFIFD